MLLRLSFNSYPNFQAKLVSKKYFILNIVFLFGATSPFKFVPLGEGIIVNNISFLCFFICFSYFINNRHKIAPATEIHQK